MNKTLLLIICDFLLLNLIHFTAWDELEKDAKENPGAGGTQSTGAGMGDPQRDLELVRLKFKQSAAELDEQKRVYINLSNTATESQQASAKKIDEAEQKALGWYRKAQEEEAGKTAAQNANRIALEQLKNRTQQANLSEEEKKALEAERKKLEAQAAKLQGDINTLEINLNAAKTNATEAQARAERELNAANTRATNERNRADKGIGAANTRADKERNRAEAAATRANNANTRANDANIAMAKATAIANEAQKQTEAATTRAHTAEQKVETVTAELVETQGNLKVAETTAKVAKEFVDKLGGDVHELEHSVKIIINNTPINANTLFQQFRGNRVKVWLKSGRTTKTTDTILIEHANFVYGLLHTSDTPFSIGPKAIGISRVEGILSTPESGKAEPVARYLKWVGFLKEEPRVLASPLMSVSEAADRSIVPYQIAAKPYQFPKAFVISRDGKSYGEVEFKFNPAHKGYVKMDKPFAGGIFSSSFNPAKGDLVLSQKGELLGMMANNTYCFVISNLKSESSIAFRKDLNRATIAKTLKTHHATIQRKAFALR